MQAHLRTVSSEWVQDASSDDITGDNPHAPKHPHPSFAIDAATPVQTPRGICRLDDVRIEDHVQTHSGAFVKVTETDIWTITQQELHDTPEIAPIRFDPGALPDMSADRAILVSPDLPIHWNADDADGLGPCYPARAFSDGGLIRKVIPEGGITYIRLYLARPEQLCLAGLWCTLHSDTPGSVLASVPGQKHPWDKRVFRPLM